MRYATLKANRATIAIWAVQVLLAVLFLFAGSMKLVTPVDVLAKQSAPLPVTFVQFIGVCEVLGALGLILPSALRIRPGLTPLAACGLVIIMIGATVTTLGTPQAAFAPIPAVTGVLAAVVAYTRWRVVPIRGAARSVRGAARAIA